MSVENSTVPSNSTESSDSFAEILGIYHKLSQSSEKELPEQDLKSMAESLLKGMTSPQIPMNIRVKLIEITGEKACVCFSNFLGPFLDCYLSLLRDAMRAIMENTTDGPAKTGSALLVEAILRALISLCHGSPLSNQPHMVRELSDVLLQVAHSCDVLPNNLVTSPPEAVHLSRISTAVSKAMQRMPHVNFESVLVKVIHWINWNARREEPNEEIRTSEAKFASKQLTKIIRDQLLHMNFENDSEKTEQVRENMRRFFIRTLNAHDYLKSADAVKSVWRNGLRRTALFDDARTLKFINTSMKKVTSSLLGENAETAPDSECLSTNAVLVEIVLAEYKIASRLDANTVGAYLCAIFQRVPQEIHDAKLQQEKRILSKPEMFRWAKVTEVLMNNQEKCTQGRFESLSIQSALPIFNTFNSHIDMMLNGPEGQYIDIFYLEALLGMLSVLIHSCPVILLKILECKNQDTSQVTITDGPLEQVIGATVNLFLSNLDLLRQHVNQESFKEARYASSRKALEQGRKVKGIVNASQIIRLQFGHSCALVQQIISGILDSPSNLPRKLCFSWEQNWKNTSTKGNTELTAANPTKRTKIWIPTSIKENLKRHML